MAPQPLFILRQSPDWHSLARDFRNGSEIDPKRYLPAEWVPGIPLKLVELVAEWNARMEVDFFSCRARLKEVCDDSIVQIPGARRASYSEVDNLASKIENCVAFYHDDDDWFAPDIAETLKVVLPESYDICVFPLVLIGLNTITYARRPYPNQVVGRRINFSHRYQSNNYGINGRICDRATLLGMKDHALGSEWANSHGLRDVYIDTIISATAKTPCSALQLPRILHAPARAKEHVCRYVDALREVVIPTNLRWLANRVQSLIELFSAVANPAQPVRRARVNDPALVASSASDATAPGRLRPLPGRRVSAVTARPLWRSATAARGDLAPAPVESPGDVGPEVVSPPQRHTGIGYLRFLRFVAQQIAPSTYFEIGTRNGASLSQVDCDAICVDPKFGATNTIVNNRRRAFLFQMTSDDFFVDYDVSNFFPTGIDMAFLDGLHLFEFLLRDQINTEKYCHRDSIIFLHDCLPFNKSIIGRARKPGAWAGDVWKILPILKRYRPDIKVVLFDCPPTGLVACTNLRSDSSALIDAYSNIVKEFADLTEPPSDLQSMYTQVNTRWLVNHPRRLAGILPMLRARMRTADDSAPPVGDN
jgi:hypothetical protein